MTDSSTTADQTVLKLDMPRLPRATMPVEGAHYGVPKHIYDLEPMGCTVEVDAYVGQARGDTVSINLNGELALDSDQTQDLDDTVTLHIPHGKLLPGIVNRLTYTVMRGSDNLGTSEPPLEILYNSIRPGIEDTTPGDNAHSELVLLLPDEIKNGVGPGFTRATVCVTYPYCRAYDRIRLNCNGHDVYHTVADTEAPSPPDHGSPTPTTVCFDVTSADLGNDHPRFLFSFTVNDQLNNSPDPDAPWSAVQTVDVDQAGIKLPAPIPREIRSDATDDPSTIDLEKLGANPLLLIVLTGDPRFMPGDAIEATYVTKVTGQPDIQTPAMGLVEVDEFSQKKTCVLEIPNDRVVPGSTVEMSYTLFRGTEQVGASRTARATVIGVSTGELPAPVIDEALGDHLDPANVPGTGATVRIDAEARLKTNDTGEMRWVGAPGVGSKTIPFLVMASEEGQDKTVTVPLEVVEANDGRTITLDYTLYRATGAPSPPSPPSVYDVNRRVGSGKLLVMGARGTSLLFCIGKSDLRYLTALDATTRRPLEALWQYEGDSGVSVRGSLFRDIQPWRMLQVSTSDDMARINPANVFGNGNSRSDLHPDVPMSAFAARRNKGNLIGWGIASLGGNVPPTIITHTDIIDVIGNAEAFAARRANGRVIAWGVEASGGEIPRQIADLDDIEEVVGTAFAFAARRTNGHLVAWGSPDDGGKVPDDIAALNIVELAASDRAFCARTDKRRVRAWGDATEGGVVPPDIASLDDIVALSRTQYALAARRANGSVVAWGNADFGGAVPGPIAALSNIVELLGGGRSFVARQANKHLVAWGSATHGGTLPDAIAVLDDIVQVVDSTGAFAGLRSNGHVVAWGYPSFGGEVPADIATLDDIVQIAASIGAFAALRANGTVVAWGYTAWGGDTTAVASQLTDVRAIYANGQAFAAVTDDGRVVTWGLAEAGGNSDAVQDQLRGQVSYEATPASRGAERLARGGALT